MLIEVRFALIEPVKELIGFGNPLIEVRKALINPREPLIENENVQLFIESENHPA